MNNKLFLLLFLGFSTLFALPPPLDLNSSHTYIGESMLVYEDSSTKLNFNDIAKLPLNDFSSIDNNIFTTPFSTSTFWYSFVLKNSHTSPLSRVFVFEAAWLDYIQINIISPDGKMQQYELGNTFDYKRRSIDNHFINQKHIFEPGLSKVYIQVKTRDPFVFATSIMDEHNFLIDQVQESRYTGIIYGVLIAMLLYNLLIFVGIRESYFGYYVLFIMVFLIMNNSYNGYLFQVFQCTSGDVQNWINSSSIFLFSLTYLLFARSFLSLKEAHEKLNSITVYFIYSLVIISLFSALIGGYRLHVIFSIIFVVITSTYIFSIAIYSWLEGNRSARFFILGSIGGLSGSIITALTVMGQISYNSIAYQALDYGMLADAILLSIALTDRIKLTQEAKNIAEIEKTFAEAEKLIAEESAQTDVLTGLLNRRAYYETSSNEIHRARRYKTDLSLIILDIDHFKDFNDNYGHDVGDKALKHFADILMKVKREYDYTFRLGGDEFIILLPETDEAEATNLAERIKEEVKKHGLNIDNNLLKMSTSFGVSQLQDEDRSIQEVEKRADIALYDAKNLKKSALVKNLYNAQTKGKKS